MEKILILDDDPGSRYLLQEVLSDYELCTTATVEEFWQQLDTFQPDLVLLDIMLPGDDGYSIRMKMTSHYRWMEIPVIFISALNTAEALARGFSLGAYDYISKPYKELELSSRVRASLERRRIENGLKKASITDYLTGFYSRQYLDEQLTVQLELKKRKNIDFSLTIMDLDHFKEVNDTYGHQTGDEFLKLFTRAVRAAVRPYDIPIRFGGDEFVLLLPDTSLTQAGTVIDRIREDLKTAALKTPQGTLNCTFSAGICCSDELPGMPQARAWLLEKADQRLYRAKTQGRSLIIATE